jgi:hypothetical protein
MAIKLDSNSVFHIAIVQAMGREVEEKLGTLISSDQRNKKFANALDCAEL